jgi:hypothetical protein
MREDPDQERDDHDVLYLDHARLSQINNLPESPRAPTMAPSNVPLARQSSRAAHRAVGKKTRAALFSLLVAAPVAMAEGCFTLSGSTQCPAFGAAPISTDNTLVGFLYAPSLVVPNTR